MRSLYPSRQSAKSRATCVGAEDVRPTVHSGQASALIGRDFKGGVDHAERREEPVA